MLPLMWQISIPSVILPVQNRKTEFSCDSLMRFLSTEGGGNGIIESYAESELQWEDTLMTTWEQKRDSSPLRGPLAPYDGLLRVTPGFPGTCQGRVHSVFHRVVNVEMQSEGDRRLLVLAAPQVPALPDSICLPPQLLPTFQVGQEVTLDGQLLSWQNTAVRLRTDSHFSGKLDRQEGQPCLKKLTACTTQLHSGFDRLPAPLRYRAEQALLEGRWQAFLGLGSGLTPSFDDACVGMAAIYTATGRSLPPLEDLSVTTDVSARYLRLAQRGYFGEPLLALIHALWKNHAGIPAAARALEAVGASSGSDMIYGVRLALAHGSRF